MGLEFAEFAVVFSHNTCEAKYFRVILFGIIYYRIFIICNLLL